ncbi:hypothetical protein [Elizabethkingia miricola]|uniref:hypothetical protein n=1 Tax=Elizabethkingia miricola TaxID=172045 RepID=UPI001121B6DC|nr:hypothetical protein [Elizabethkingia miricola]NHQ65233.1 hypothetical protein [Elizabethkingia miricola]NHQ72098.1 hypothetical protein [Elizabethkingia miricola]NHQ76396.1 hypothetical protein [Elizabethkingia miricola]QHQ86247.1 hypothetical protein FE632_05410 [Elizabethkingia miricola]UIO97511.1 hypothetical protein LYZ41_05340 [Elizabethkingia miricola]
MKQSLNIWRIKEFDGNGMSCPVIPARLPFYKKLVLFFFRFGICPLCITMSLVYNIRKSLKKTMHL